MLYQLNKSNIDIAPQKGSKFMNGVISKTQRYSPSYTNLPQINSFKDIQSTNFTERNFGEQNVEFISSIINKIKGVSRSKTSKEIIRINTFLQQEMSTRPKAVGFNKIKQTEIENKKSPTSLKIFQKAEGNLIQIDKKHSTKREGELSLLQLQNSSLKKTIEQIKHSLASIQKTCEDYERQLKIKNQRIASLQGCLQQKQICFANELEQLCSTIEEIKSQNKRLQNCLEDPIIIECPFLFFNIEQTVNEIIYPSNNISLTKVQNQIKLLKCEIVHRQKKSLNNYNALMKQKNDQMDLLRKSFQRNINYYKELALKYSLKSKHQVN